MSCFVIIPRNIYNDGIYAITEYIENAMGDVRYDYYVIGGRYNGIFKVKSDNDENDSFDDYDDNLGDNCISVVELLNLYENNHLKFHTELVTSDGQYHEHLATRDKFMNLVKKEIDNYVVCIDYHF